MNIRSVQDIDKLSDKWGLCRICGNALRTPTSDLHVHERAPADQSICIGCWWAGVELEMFLTRAVGSTVMGDWTAGWLREIIKDPARYR